MGDALRLMIRAVGDEHGFREVFHEVAAQEAPLPPFQNIPRTTWDDLEGSGYVDAAHSMGAATYVLTGRGWIAALKAARLYNTPEHAQRVIALRRALVDLNKGRPSHGTLVSIFEIVGCTSLPRGWITSAVDSQLLREWFGDDHMELDVDGRVIRIPPRFAVDRIDFDPEQD
jgi:hypothetical protein